MNKIFDFDFDQEQLVFCQDGRSGLKAIIAIHSTALGPALGGTRFYPYGSEDAAIADVLRLAKGMTYKSALAGLDLGGGKAVIIGDPARDKSEALLRAYGAFVASLGGRYVTACDVGTDSADMDLIARECAHTTGRSTVYGGAGDSSVLTAFGVSQAIRASAEQLWATACLHGRRVGVEGVGKVGAHLVDHLIEAGATVVVHDVNPAAIAAVVARHPGVEVEPDRHAFLSGDLDIYSPCALGGVLTAEVVDVLQARLVCGGANNQLAEPGVAKLLADRGILYAPDYVVNAGGLIQVADEIGGFDFDRAKLKATEIYQTTKRVFALAAERDVPPVIAADLLAEQRISDIAAVRSLAVSPR